MFSHANSIPGPQTPPPPHPQPTCVPFGIADSGSLFAPGIPSEGQPGGSANLGFDPPPRVQELVAHLKRFMDEHVYPSEHILDAHAADPNTKWTVHPRMEELKVTH